MNICNNCSANLTCSCQKRKASDGQSCCSKCISKYEADNKNSIESVVISSPTAPQNLTAVYKGPGQQLD